ncbi:acyltransferase [Sporosarcina sp. E16_3]|uniref:acyltransferase n=1 Tax=Sporosarcina sp. E16_3 TaxID=2789293 RepID=UPI0031FCA501
MKKMIKSVMKYIPYIKSIHETRTTAAPITLRTFFFQKVIGINRRAYWPTHFTSMISRAENIEIGIGTAPGLSPGCYIQGLGKIIIGDYTLIAPNVGIISANHDTHDYRKHIKSEVIIGDYCWIGMNTTIMPGVKLGDHTIVAAGSVVTKPFEDGYCVLAGSPAKIIKVLESSECVKYYNEYEYYGYIKKENFNNFKKRKLMV